MKREENSSVDSRRNLKLVVLLLFALTGLTGLVYEVLWRRMLSVVMGGSIYATAAVLSAFMGGLCLGSIVVGRWADRWKNLLRAYGIFELLIAAFAIFFPLVCTGLVSLQRLLYPAVGDDYLLMTGVKFAAAFLLLLVPTFLMGGTFPLVSRFYVRESGFVGKGIGRLYAVNTGGAVLGTILAGFFLIRLLGVLSTNWIAIALNAAVGVAAILISLRVVSKPAPERAAATASKTGIPLWTRRAVLAAFAVSGFTALAYEVLWIRVLVFVVGSTTYSFTIMLSTFLVGLALGSYLFSRFLDRGKDLLVTVAVIEALIGVVAIVGVVLTHSFYPLYRWLKELFPSWSYVPYVFVRYAIASLSILPLSVLFGMAFPLIVAIYSGRDEKLGGDVGRAYASNTLGAVFGSVAAVFLLIPLCGIAVSFLMMAAVNVVIGLWFLRLSPLLTSRIKVYSATAAVVIFGCVAIALPVRIDIGKTTEGVEGNRGSLIFYREGSSGTVAVFFDPDLGQKMMEIDGKSQVPTDLDARQAFRLLGHLPFFFHTQPKEVLVTAFGGGITTASILAHPVDRVDAVEICPSVFEAARFFEEENDKVLEDDRLNLIVGDANSYVKTTDRTYDLIASDATHPAASESWVLYTREFYAACRKLLRKGGVMCQWFPLHALPTPHLKSILRTFQSVFPHTSFWFARGYTVVLGTPQPLVINVERMSRVLRRNERTYAQLRDVHLESVPAILKNLVLDESDVRRFAAGASLVTENKSDLAFAENLAIGRRWIPINLRALAGAVGEGFPSLVAATDQEEREVSAAVAVRRSYLQALRCWHERKGVQGLKYLEKAAVAGWEDADLGGYLRLLTILAFRQYQKGEPLEKAVRDFRHWKAVFPESPWTRIALGHFLIDKGEEGGEQKLVEDGLEELRRGAELAPGDPIVLQDVAQAFLSARRDEQAIPFLERLIERVPDDTQNWHSLIGAYLRTGQDAKAIPFLEKLAARSPNDPASWSTLAGAYIGSQQYREARDAILRALRLDPGNPVLRGTLRKLESMLAPVPIGVNRSPEPAQPE